MNRAPSLVVFTGAGISQESGISTFRDPGGLWDQFRPEELATPEAFAARPEVVWRWYRWRFDQVRRARPNAGHLAIASWQERFPSLVVVTQNVDRLHQRAGSRAVLELHGDLWTARCARCGEETEMERAMRLPGEPPRCACGGLLRPNVVWFGEGLPEETFERAYESAAASGLFLVVGTSARVYPAAGLIEVAARAGARIVEVNREETPLSGLATETLRGAAGEILPELGDRLAGWLGSPR
jgi:NAD-dependent deacetylase